MLPDMLLLGAFWHAAEGQQRALCLPFEQSLSAPWVVEKWHHLQALLL